MYDILSPTPPLTRYSITEGRAPAGRPRRAVQPADLREGVAKAYDTVREVRRPVTQPSVTTKPSGPGQTHEVVRFR